MVSKTPKLTKNLKKALVAICNDTKSEKRFRYTAEYIYKPLLEMGYVEINSEIVEDDEVATRATEKGLTECNIGDTKQETVETPKPKGNKTMEFEIKKGVEMPTMNRGSKGSRKYPFDDMEVGDGFPVPKTEDMPEPVKTVSSAVSSQNKRYCTETPVFDDDGNVVLDEDGKPKVTKTYSKKWAVRSTDKNHPFGEGAGVWRII